MLSSGDFGLLSNGWEGIPATGYRWQAHNAITSSAVTGPDIDHTTGTGMYMYTEASSGIGGDTAELVSECIAIETVGSPVFSFWSHRYGTEIGSMFVDIESGGIWTNLTSVSGPTHTGPATIDPAPFSRCGHAGAS